MITTDGTDGGHSADSTAESSRELSTRTPAAPLAGLARDALTHYLAQYADVTRICIAYSGGMDSHVLLHLATDLLSHRDDIKLRALHVDHRLSPDSGDWARHAQIVAESLGVPLLVRVAAVERGDDGPEAAARRARYAIFTSELNTGEHLMLAQHAGDQAETFLLQALRGSGPDGLASIPRKRVFGAGFMTRPLLGCPREALAAVAEADGLSWVEDPSNADTALDRNFLRHEVLPLLESRWPAAVRTLGRSAHRSAAASQTLLGLAREDLSLVRVRGADELSVSQLRIMPRERAYNAIRLWVRQAGYRMPRLQDLTQVIDHLVRARDDTAGRVDVRDYEFRRYRDRLYLLPPQVDSTAFEVDWPAPYNDLEIPSAGVVLSREGCARQGIALPPNGTITVRNREGGELIRVGEPAFHKEVRKVMQETGVPPWQRDKVPLLYVGNRLAAVWNLAVAVDFRFRFGPTDDLIPGRSDDDSFARQSSASAGSPVD